MHVINVVCGMYLNYHLYLFYRELGGSCKLVLDVIKCEPPAVKVIMYTL